MIRTFLLALCAALAVVSTGLGQQRGPKILVVQNDFNYGFVPDSSYVAHTFWVNNIGTDSLKIFNVKMSCGCTKAAFDRATVAVNDSVPLEIVFDNHNRLKKQGRVTTILCNDPSESRYELSFLTYNYVAGENTGPITVTKNRRLRLTTNDFGKQFLVTIKNVSQQPLEAKLIVSPVDVVTVVMPKEPIAPGAKADILVQVRNDIKDKNQLKSFTFEVSDAAKTRYTIPIRLAEPLSSLEHTSKRP